MTDPYQVLGVSPSATDEQIKTAYRELARKYHPDNYANNPLADLAQEKMKEINEAYDQIQRQRKQQQSYSTGNGYSRQSYGGQSYSNQGSTQFTEFAREHLLQIKKITVTLDDNYEPQQVRIQEGLTGDGEVLRDYLCEVYGLQKGQVVVE